MSPPDIYAALTLEERLYKISLLFYAFSTVLILPSCREEKDENDFDKKRREPIIQRNNKQPSCPDSVMILPLEQF
jgi:hypothetical protein